MVTLKSIILVGLFDLIFAYAPWLYNGTTPDLEIIVKGRCSMYKVLGVDNRDPELRINFNCSDFYDTFTKAFKGKDPCQTNFNGAYDELFKFMDNGESITDKVSLIFVLCNQSYI